MPRESLELVFVYGTLRKTASNAFRLKGASFEGMRVVRGTLYQIDWYPGVVLDRAETVVIGELWGVTPDQLRELDEFEGVTEGHTEGEEYRRVRVEAEGLPDFDASSGWDPAMPIEAWIWEWKGTTEMAQVISTGDWLDVEAPRRGPLFTSIGCMGVLAFTIGTQALLAMLASPFASFKVSHVVESWVMFASMVAAIVVGGYSLRMATRRREPGYPFQLLTGLALLLFLMLVVINGVIRLFTALG